jgi:hypothetical protein
MSNQFQNENLTISRVRLCCTVERPIIWNSFPGSVIHGVLGYHLKRLTCIRPVTHCDDCQLANSCPYCILIEPRQTAQDRTLRLHSRNPSPLRLVIFPWQESGLETDTCVILEITLIGKAVKLSKLILYALIEAFKEGVGRKDRDGLRGTLRVNSVELPFWAKQIQFDSIRYDNNFEFTFWDALQSSHNNDGTLTFITPTRIVEKGKVQSEPSLRAILSTVLRRITGLAFFHCGVELDANYAGLLDLASKTKYENNYQRYNAQRYSARQKKRMNIDGIIGSISWEFIQEDIIPWFIIGQHFGCGKGTTMGYGEYKLSE